MLNLEFRSGATPRPVGTSELALVASPLEDKNLHPSHLACVPSRAAVHVFSDVLD
jgi:hypothetical protein